MTYTIVSGAGGSISGSTFTASAGTGTIQVRATKEADGTYSAKDSNTVLLTLNAQPAIASFTLGGNAANINILYGQSVAIASSMTDANENLATHSLWWDRGNGSTWTHPLVTWSYAPDATGWSGMNFTDTAASAGTNSVRSGIWKPAAIGTYQFHTNGADATGWWGPGLTRSVTVARAPLTITADDKQRVYGAANPELTASYSGLVNGDTNAVVSGFTLSTTATTSSAPGTYPITASGGTAANYDVTRTAGTLTINKAPITPPTSQNATVTYGTSWSPTYFGGTAGAGAKVYAVSGITNYGSAACVLPASSTPYTFWVAQLGNANYHGNTVDPLVGDLAVNFTAYTLEVLPVSVQTSVSVASVSAPRISASGSSIDVSATVSGSTTPNAGTVTFTLRNADGVAIATTEASVSGGAASATISVPGGTSMGTGYYVTASYGSATSGNYSWQGSSANSGTFSILPNPIVAAGLRAWYRADFGVSTDTGGGVSVWADASGRGLDLVQSRGPWTTRSASTGPSFRPSVSSVS